MEDIIDIIVTETTNTIEITSQSTDEVIDVNIIDNRDDIVLNVTPSVIEININSLTGNFGVNWGQITGTLSNQTDLNTALGLKADLVGGKVPSSQLPSYVDDVVEVANYAALPATGETGKIYVILDTNKIYRWSGSVYVEIADSTAVWGAITGTLSSQTDLQTALNAKFNNPTGDSTQYLNGAGTPTTFPIAGQAGTLVREVRNTTGATLTKGTIVYISGATGNKPTVSKAIATGDSTSAQTFGMCQADIANNSNGYVVCTGDLSGLDTSAVSEGVQLYLSSTTAGTYTTTKQVAPAHLVYIGVVTRSHPTQGQIEVKIQNGYELDEIHDVLITSKANNDGLFYESSTSLWKNKSIATVLGYSPEQPLTFNSPLSRSSNAVSIPAATSSVNGYLTSADWTTFNAKQSALSFSGPLVLSGSTVYILTASSAQNGYLSAADWTTFNSKQAALSGTGFVKISGTTISYDSSTYVDNANNQSIAGVKTFTTQVNSAQLRFSESGGFGNVAGYTQIGGTADYFNFVNGVNSKQATFNYGTGGTGYTYTLPNSNGTLALTSALSSYLPLSGGTLTGPLSGTSATFSGTGYSIFQGSAYLQTPASTGLSFGYNRSGGNGESTIVYGAPASGFNFEIASVTSGTITPRLTITNAGAATFSGALSGTSATFSGPITTNGVLALKLNYAGSVNDIQLSAGTPMRIVNQAYNSVLFELNNSGTANFSGNVGIGTTSPESVSSFTTLQVDGTSGAMLRTGTSAYGGYVSTIASADVMVISNVRNPINGTFSNTSKAASVISLFGESNNGYLTFSTSPTNNTGPTERMRITSGGNVGIGTTSPTDYSGYTTLHLNGKSGANGGLLRLTASDNSSSVNIYAGGSAINFNTTSAVPFVWLTQDTERMRITSDGIIQISTTTSIPTTNNSIFSYSSNNTMYIQGASGGLGLSASGSRNNIIYVNETSNYIRFDTNNAGERMRITSGGNVGINVSSPSYRLQVDGNVYFKGASSGSGDFALVVQNSSSTNYLLIRNDGMVYAPGIYNNTNSNLPNVWVNSDGSMYRSTTSSQRFKENINDWSGSGLNTILALKPKTFKYKKDYYNLADVDFLGLIAEEVAEVSPYLAEYQNQDRTGLVENVRYATIVVPLIKAVQELKAELDTLKNK